MRINSKRVKMRSEGRCRKAARRSKPNVSSLLNPNIVRAEHRDELASKYKARVFDFIAKVSLF